MSTDYHDYVDPPPPHPGSIPHAIELEGALVCTKGLLFLIKQKQPGHTL